MNWPRAERWKKFCGANKNSILDRFFAVQVKTPMCPTEERKKVNFFPNFFWDIILSFTLVMILELRHYVSFQKTLHHLGHCCPYFVCSLYGHAVHTRSKLVLVWFCSGRWLTSWRRFCNWFYNQKIKGFNFQDFCHCCYRIGLHTCLGRTRVGSIWHSVCRKLIFSQTAWPNFGLTCNWFLAVCNPLLPPFAFHKFCRSLSDCLKQPHRHEWATENHRPKYYGYLEKYTGRLGHYCSFSSFLFPFQDSFWAGKRTPTGTFCPKHRLGPHPI